MSLEGLIALAVMVIGGLIVMVYPFITVRSNPMSNKKRYLNTSRDELIVSYERVLSTLRDLEDDFKSGKIHAEDYETERAYWSQYGVRLLQVLEGNTEAADDEPTQQMDDADVQLDQSVEEAIQNYRMALQSVDQS